MLFVEMLWRMWKMFQFSNAFSTDFGLFYPFMREHFLNFYTVFTGFPQAIKTGRNDL